MRRASVISRVTGAIRSTVVTLSSRAENTAVTTDSITSRPHGSAFTTLAAFTATYWNTPLFCVMATMHHHAGEQADGVEVDAGKGFGLVQHPGKNHQAGAQQRDHGAVDLLGDDDGVGQHENRERHQQRRQAEDRLGRRQQDPSCQLPALLIRCASRVRRDSMPLNLPSAPSTGSGYDMAMQQQGRFQQWGVLIQRRQVV